MAAEQAVAISIKPSEFTQGTGLVDDIDATIKSARWHDWDYGGKSNNRTLAVLLTLADDEGQIHEQYYSAGDPAAFVILDEGKSIESNGKRTSLSNSSNFYMLMTSLIEAGYPEEKITGSDVSFLDGMYAHFIRKPQPERKGLKKDPNDTRDKTVLCFSKIYEKKGKAGGAMKPGAGAAAKGKVNGAAAAADTDLDAEAMDAVLNILGMDEVAGSVTRTKLSQLMFKQLKGNPNASKIITLAFKADFLAAEGRPWAFDGTTVSMG